VTDYQRGSLVSYSIFVAIFAVLFALMLISGCGKACDMEERNGCFRFHGSNMMSLADAQKALRLADEAWGKYIDLKHYEIDFLDDDLVDCGGKDDSAIGCTCSKWPCSWMKIARAAECDKAFIFWHELGHVAEPDAPHSDPRFTPHWTFCER